MDEFFKNLCDRCVITLERCETDINALEYFRNVKGAADLGYCYYTKRDLDRAQSTGVLSLHWGIFGSDELNYITVANAILDEGQACGLKMSWSGSVDDKITAESFNPTE